MPSATKLPGCTLTLEQRKATRELARLFNRGKAITPAHMRSIARQFDITMGEVAHLIEVIERTTVSELAANAAEQAYQ